MSISEQSCKNCVYYRPSERILFFRKKFFGYCTKYNKDLAFDQGGICTTYQHILVKPTEKVAVTLGEKAESKAYSVEVQPQKAKTMIELDFAGKNLFMVLESQDHTDILWYIEVDGDNIDYLGRDHLMPYYIFQRQGQFSYYGIDVGTYTVDAQCDIIITLPFEWNKMLKIIAFNNGVAGVGAECSIIFARKYDLAFVDQPLNSHDIYRNKLTSPSPPQKLQA